jgi:hypothetical protein
MAYSIDPQNGDIVISGFSQGIGTDPYSGLTDLKSVNIGSIPNEASVSFGTKSVSAAPNTGSQTTTVTTASNLLLIPTSLNVESYQWVIFTSVGTSGLTLNTPYQLFYFGQSGLNYEYQLYTQGSNEFPANSAVTITGNSAVTWYTVVPSLTKYFTKSGSYSFMIDSLGLVWSDRYLTGTGGGPSTGSWTWIGNAGKLGVSADTSANGNGILIYQTIHNGTGATGTPATYDEWLFVWRNSQIDYTQIISDNANTSIVWNYQWNPTTGTVGGGGGYLQTSSLTNNPHMAIQTLPNFAVYCDSFYVAVFAQNIPALASSSYTGFNPQDKTTYYFNNFAILPPNDVAQCLSFLNQNVLIGGRLNYIYPWNVEGLALKYTAPAILVPESNISCIVTVGNNAYVFAGNRGIIYITNGSQADEWKKVPDHISGTVEPLFFWGGSETASAPTGTAVANKNRLYFGCQVGPQAGGSISGYGGIWCVDLNSGALWNSNQMSYGTYAGYVSALGVSSQQATYGPNVGYGLLAGWSDGGTPNYGIDASIAAPYTGGQSYIISDLIPIGTNLEPQTPAQFEFKLSVPLQSSESVALYGANNLADMLGQTGSYVEIGSVTGGTNTLSYLWPNALPPSQWLITKAILTSQSSTPSYDRLTQIRVKGLTLKLTSSYGTK